MKNFARLIEVAEINPRLVNASSFSPDSITSFVPMAAVSEKSGSIVVEEERPLCEVLKGFTYFQNDDVLVAKITPCFENGKIAHAKIRNALGFGSTEFHVVRANTKRLDSRYLYHFLRQERIRAEGERKMTGSAGQRRIPKNFIENLSIPLPPLTEQHRITSALDKADDLCKKRQQVIKKLDTLLQAVFLDMFGDPVKNPKGWAIQPLGELLKFTTGKLDANAAVVGGAYPFFTCSRENYQIDTYAFDCEALLLAGNNATADYSVKYYKGKFNAYQRTYVITLLNPKHSYSYMKYALEKKLQEMKRLSKGTNTKYLTLSILQNLKLQVPPHERQAEFDLVSSKINEHFKKHNESLHLLNDLFSSLQQCAFNGELFIGEVEPDPPNLETTAYV